LNRGSSQCLGPQTCDFSTGDWWQDFAAALPITWTARPPDFFWADVSSSTPDPFAAMREIGRAWYHGFCDDGLGFAKAERSS
jgi:hypothetical protein